ncbi:MAG TPA: NUDIX domain-containing protein [Solirubrobacterales bacterium]
MKSAGILLFRGGAGLLEVLLVHPGGPYWAKKDLGAWSVPKGEVEDGEDPRACALRELGEELGPNAPVLTTGEMIELGSVRQKSSKAVECWAAPADFDPARQESNTFAMEWPPRSGAEQEFPEVDRAEWFKPDVAREKLIEAQAAFVDRLLDHLEPGPGD